MIAVGVGIAPMIQTIQCLLNQRNQYQWQKLQHQVLLQEQVTQTTSPSTEIETKPFAHLQHIVLLYGVRTVQDILLRNVLETWQQEYSDFLTIIFCVGSRWNNIHWGAKKATEYTLPPLPKDFETLNPLYAEIGWINEEKIVKYATPPSINTRVIVCGLPGVYDKICGHREIPHLVEYSILHKLGYTNEMVIKL
jgi:NAD(P)H-flavin reductase